MIKNIIFDWDGVILDSNAVKDSAFEYVLRQHDPLKVSLLLKYHRENGGISRFKKFRLFFEEILEESISDDGVMALSDEFSEFALKELVSPDLQIAQSIDWVISNHQKYNLHVASGSCEKELQKVAAVQGLSQYFLSIQGSPIPKEVLVEQIIESNAYEVGETVLIGDSINDFHAAEANGLAFYGFNRESLRLTGKAYLDNFEDLNSLLK